MVPGPTPKKPNLVFTWEQILSSSSIMESCSQLLLFGEHIDLSSIHKATIKLLRTVHLISWSENSDLKVTFGFRYRLISSKHRTSPGPPYSPDLFPLIFSFWGQAMTDVVRCEHKWSLDWRVLWRTLQDSSMERNYKMVRHVRKNCKNLCIFQRRPLSISQSQRRIKQLIM